MTPLPSVEILFSKNRRKRRVLSGSKGFRISSIRRLLQRKREQRRLDKDELINNSDTPRSLSQILAPREVLKAIKGRKEKPLEQSLINLDMVTATSSPLRRKLKKIISDQRPQDWIRWIVLIVCLLVVYKQVVDCSRKLKNPPITTHSTLTLNDTLHYPALTICREPPFNKKVFPKFNFSTDAIGSDMYTTYWIHFPYDRYNISDFWEEAVYKKDVLTGSLNQNEVAITSSVHLLSGMCHTLTPLTPVANVGKKTGYTLFFSHDLYGYTPLIDDEPGWKIYVHEPTEKFSENINFLASRQDHVFVPVGERTEINIDAYQFNTLRNCTLEENYSVTECEENCTIEQDIVPHLTCTGPWFPQIKKPFCNNNHSMRVLLKATNSMSYKQCCKKKCRMTYYKVFVVKRTPEPSERHLSSTAMIYFSSKAVITMAERYSYNWNDFLGEIGGSVGFLLGLSIVGVIGILDKFIGFLWCHKEEKQVDDEGKSQKIFTVDDTVSSSDSPAANRPN